MSFHSIVSDAVIELTRDYKADASWGSSPAGGGIIVEVLKGYRSFQILVHASHYQWRNTDSSDWSDKFPLTEEEAGKVVDMMHKLVNE